MKLYSNLITKLDIDNAVREQQGAYIIDGWHGIRSFTPRSAYFRNGFELFLGGSSVHRSAHDADHMAASWTAWGEIIARLFRIDPMAHIAFYKGVDQFMEVTRSMSENDDRRAAPWLDSDMSVIA